MNLEKIRVENISASFSRYASDGRQTVIQAIKNVNFSINENEFCTIVGPSGCGKTTLLRIIHGLLIPTKGKVYINNKQISTPGFDRSFVFQNFELFPWRTASQNIEFGLEIMGVTVDKRREIVEKYLNLIGLKEFANYYPYELSGGMQQRVGLARALAINPEILLMDEPFASLDAQTRELLQAELLKIQNVEKKTILFITHSIDEATYLANRVIIMSARPSEIKEILEINLPEPRWENPEEIKSTKEFVEKRLYIWKLLKSELVLK